MDYIERALNTAYSGGIEALVDAQRTESGNITGRFIGTEGKVYAYQIDPEGIEFEESHEDSEWINDYYTAKLDAEGVEYHGDSAYEYWMGRQGVPIRRDGLQCKTGTPCGNRCIPRGHKCRVGSSGASGAALKQGGSKLKTGLKIAGGVAAAGALGAAGLGVSQYMKNKAAAKQQAEAKAQRSGMKKTVQSMPTANQLRRKAGNTEAVTTKRVLPKGSKFNKQTKFKNEKTATPVEETPVTSTSTSIPVDETVTKKKTAKRPITSRSQRKRQPGIGG